MKKVENPSVDCSFCHRTSRDAGVAVLVVMPDDSAAICGECIEIARDILGFSRQSHSDSGQPTAPLSAPFKIMPSRWTRPRK